VVYFTHNIPPPSNVNNLFGNWLNMIDKKTKTQICVGVFFCRFDIHVVSPPSYRGAWTYGYWVQSTDYGCTGFIQPGWLAAF
jgi:hypothetical protein